MKNEQLKPEFLIATIKQEVERINTTSPHQLLMEPDENNWKDVLSQCKIDSSKTFLQPQSQIDRLEPEDGFSHIVTNSGITLLLGKQKAGKTHCVKLLLAAFLKSGGIIGETLKSVTTDDERVSLVDTEQSDYNISNNYHQVQKLLNSTKDLNLLDVFALRRFPPHQRLFLTEKAVYSTPKLKMLVLDGIRDYVYDINSPEEATKISSLLLKWSVELSIAIVIVLHQNKINDNARGHLGTELVNKADTVIAVEKEDGFFTVNPVSTRNKEFSPFAFKLDEQGIPYIIPDIPLASKKLAKEASPDSMPEDLHKKVLFDTFVSFDGINPTYNDLIKAIQIAYKKHKVVVGQNRLRSFLTFYYDKKWLTAEKNREGKTIYHLMVT